MSQLTYVAYLAAGLRFLYAGHRLILVLISLILLVWFVVLAAIREQVVPDEDQAVDGWTGSISYRSAETLTAMRGVSSSSSMMLVGLSMFAPLLAVWAFLP